ncbi:uncharacterized protein LOC109537038 [Dendroctonus ponderosae]|uniref:uncharacterized protein LOC109537038 n=1 Tax=Dendroctonus ponderosae TaxID=77166 RepID=UPI0020357892|nr:uncharacterized protein LOC109537038 [Dendroctonus ponderosae]KAH1018716.1 hypothetical protein HUJ05_006433 [Dendroctonus ponderosae]
MESNGNNEGDFGEIVLDGMEVGETHYVYHDPEINLENHPQYNIVNLMIEDETRAVIVNGAVVTADGQPLILHNEEDLSQYSIDDATEEVVISAEQGNQILELINSQNNQSDNESVVHFVQNDSSMNQDPDQHVVYIQNPNSILPLHPQYQIAELDTVEYNEAMQLTKLETDQILQEIDGCIDLEHLLIEQADVPSTENGNCRYAFLKDGQLHVQGINGSITSFSMEESAEERNAQSTLGQKSNSNSVDSLDVGSIKGQSMKADQAFPVSRKTDKSVTRTRSYTQTSSQSDANKTKTSPSFSNLRKLINTKITIGQTAEGKTIVGKIINVKKKPVDLGTKKERMTPLTNCKTYPTAKQKNSQMSGITNDSLEHSRKEAIDSVNSKKRPDKIATSKSNSTLKVPNRLTSATKQEQLDQDINVANPDSGIKNVNVETQVQLLKNPSKMRTNSNQIRATTPLPSRVCSTIVKDSKSPQTDDQTHKENGQSDNTDVSAKSSEQSKIIVQKKMISKDDESFNFIAKTLSGLMNLESVVKKLENKTIIVKIMQKVYDHDSCKYSKSISYCSGCMVREFTVNETQDSFSESWNFISDSNSKETILNEYSLETTLKNATKMKKFANITIQITTNLEGQQTTKVILNPPALLQCKGCTKAFRTSALLKMHSLSCPPALQPENVSDPVEMKSVEAPKDVLENKSMHGCVECNQSFTTSQQLQNHMDMHYKMNMCPICKLKLSSVAERNTHLMTHSDSEMPQALESSMEDEKGDNNQPSNNKKGYTCHICKKQFSRHSNMQRHVEIHKEEGAIYQCAICSCCYHYISSLTRHVLSTHVDPETNVLENGPSNETESNDNNSQDDQQEAIFQDEEIEQIVDLDEMDEGYLQQYVVDNFELENLKEDEIQNMEIQ